MKITCLCEDTLFSERFFCEHGLSLYIETNNKKILFDMGQTDVFYKNAKLLGVDLSQADIAVLSHGHYDHGGGIKTFLTINNSAKIYMSEHVFGDFYNSTGKYIGLDGNLKNNNRFVFCDGYKKLGEGLELLSLNKEDLTTSVDSAGLTMKKDGKVIPDDFMHEQYLKITENGKTYLFSGCSHMGVVNIAKHFRPDALIGGFHLIKQNAVKDNPTLNMTADNLNDLNIRYYTCHCTGHQQYEILKEQMADNLYYCAAGQILEL